MECPDCKNEMEHIDDTYSNYNSGRARKGEKTGEIWQCDHCEVQWLDDFLNKTLRPR